MATDYDAPRRDEVDLGADSIEELKSRRSDAQSASVDVDEIDVAEGFELPGAELADEELTVKVLPMQADVFLAPHGSLFGLLEKRAALARNPPENPFVDPAALPAHVLRLREAFERRLAEQLAAPPAP